MTALPTPDDVGSFYDRVSDMFGDMMGDNLHVGYWAGPDAPTTMKDAAERLTDLLIGELRVASGKRVLDLGCGTGQPAVRLARAAGVDVVGVTISGAQVELATQRAAAEGLADRVRFKHANAMALPFPDDSFDAAWSIESLLHMPDRLTALRELARVLRPGGRVVLADPVLRYPDMTDDQRAGLLDLYEIFQIVDIPPIDDYPRLIRDAGFQLDRLTDIGDDTDRHRLGPRGWILLAEGLRHSGILTSVYGMTPTERDALLTRMAALERAPEQGYLLVAAHSVKPAAARP